MHAKSRISENSIFFAKNVILLILETARRPDPIGAESVQTFEKSIELAAADIKGDPPMSADGRPMTWMEYVKSELAKSDSTS